MFGISKFSRTRVHGPHAQYPHVEPDLFVPPCRRGAWVALRHVGEDPVPTLIVGSPEWCEWSSAAECLWVAPERAPRLDMDFQGQWACKAEHLETN